MKLSIVRLCCVLCVGFGALPAIASAQAPAASPSAPPAAAAPAKKKSPHMSSSFRGNVDAVDAATKSFTLKGQKVTRTVKVLPTTNLLKRAGGNAAFDDLKTGEYVTGSAKKTGENQYEAITVKVGPKTASDAPKKPRKKAAAPAASPSPSPAH